MTPRGAGTNLVGSTVPGGGIILDLSRMNRILDIDPATFTATVEPGVLLKDFQARVESLGLFYPPDPGEKASTLGGNISTNAGGMRAVKYGVTRDYVRGLTVVLANGDVVELGSRNVKDASGLDLRAACRRFGRHAGRDHALPPAPGGQAGIFSYGAGSLCRSR